MAEKMDSNKLNVQCTYSGCSKYFENEKDMKRHKVNEPEHNYCKKCNVDCEDWEALIKHKVEAMAPFLEGRMRNKDESPKHIVCEFCGIDFKSFGGRRHHRDHEHQADQNIECKGCSEVFTRAGNYIAHLEQGRCSVITQRDFVENMQQKHVSKEIWKNPWAVRQGLEVNEAFAPTSDYPGRIMDGSETQASEQGGVTLLDHEDEDQKRGYQPLQAEVDLIDWNDTNGVKLPHTRSEIETWPRLPGQTPSKLTESMRNMSLDSRASSVSGSERAAGRGASDITSYRKRNKVYDESYPSLNPPTNSTSSFHDDDDSSSEATTTVASLVNRPVPWTTKNTSNALFKDAKPTPSPGNWAAIAEDREQGVIENERTDLLNNRFWDIHSKDFNVERFFYTVIERYCCPFPECDGVYDSSDDIKGHMQHAHAKVKFRCPLCLKIFWSANALISHSESGGRCKVKNSRTYDKLLDEISGGFLTAKHLKQPKVYNLSNAAGQAVDGVMSTEFKAKSPNEEIKW